MLAILALIASISVFLRINLGEPVFVSGGVVPTVTVTSAVLEPVELVAVRV